MRFPAFINFFRTTLAMRTARSSLLPCALSLFLALLPGLASADTLYKSVGPDGKVTYSDRPPASGSIQKTLSFENLPASPLPDSVLTYRKELQASLQKRLSGAAPRTSSGVQLFTAAWCGYCRKAKAYLAEKNIRYQELDIDTPDGQQSFVQAGSASGIPLLLAKGKRVQGFSKGAYDAFFTD